MDKVLILDFGSQYTQLIARRIREAKVYCEIEPCTVDISAIRAFAPQAIVLSGGPASVSAPDAPQLNPEILSLGVPVLGICYGMQLLAKHFGGEVVPAKHREYGRAKTAKTGDSPLWQGLPDTWTSWMSHGDTILRLPEAFAAIAKTESGVLAAMAHRQLPIYALQFHPEVVHTETGKQILANFLFSIA